MSKAKSILEFIAKIDFDKLPTEIKNVLVGQLKNYKTVLKSSHYYRIKYDDTSFIDDNLKNQLTNKTGFPVTIDKDTLMFQYKQK